MRWHSGSVSSGNRRTPAAGLSALGVHRLRQLVEHVPVMKAMARRLYHRVLYRVDRGRQADPVPTRHAQSSVDTLSCPAVTEAEANPAIDMKASISRAMTARSLPSSTMRGYGYSNGCFPVSSVTAIWSASAPMPKVTIRCSIKPLLPMAATGSVFGKAF